MFAVIEGDLEPNMGIAILDEDGAAEDISDASAYELRWLDPDGTLTTVALVEDVAEGGLEAGALKRVWVAGDTDVVGVHQGQVVVTRGNGETQTYPSDGTFIKWRVFAQLTAE